MADRIPVSVVETREFSSKIDMLLDREDYLELIEYLAYHPTEGDAIKGTGGLRKLRWGIKGRGKRGGSRVIYFFHSENMPLFALTVFAKNEQVDLTDEDRTAYRNLTNTLINMYEKGHS